MAFNASGKMATESDEEIIPASDSDDSDYENTAEENYDPLSNPSDIGSESEQGSDNNEDILANPVGVNCDGPNPYGLPEKRIINYDGDYEDQDDYFDGWKWNCFTNDEDSGPDIGPFLGKQQILFDYRQNEPFHFFNQMFSPEMFDSIADSTNRYASQKVNRQSKYKFLLHLFHIILLITLQSFHITGNTLLLKIYCTFIRNNSEVLVE